MSLSRLNWPLCSHSHKAKIKVSARPGFCEEALGKNPLPGLFSLWVGLSSRGCSNEAPISLLVSQGLMSPLQATHTWPLDLQWQQCHVGFSLFEWFWLLILPDGGNSAFFVWSDYVDLGNLFLLCNTRHQRGSISGTYRFHLPSKEREL